MRNKIPQRDLNQRLHNTVNRYKGIPYYFVYTGGDSFEIRDLINGRGVSIVNAYDPEIDISSPPLGYCQITEDHVVYVTRRPVRLYKQGLAAESLSFKFLSAAGRNFRVNMSSKPFHDMIIGSYQSVDVFFERIRKNPDVALEFAVSNQIALKYSPAIRLAYVYVNGDEQVGYILENTRTVKVPSTDKAWIISSMMEGFNWTID